ncbi:hypothetical protein CHS0354_037998 [Potamilus streckersoni]|uniref:G-protein coupled receptors family 1 profile domain-containing protein n=1 Tax=Potamilus streckersoni TaxID=2493646 RepID=A0AAE0TG22_9BIVA|nr:hypothetical protein CHS0354_037998 [Potamilus streckersoni]
MFGNGLVVISFAKFKRLQTTMNTFLISLAVADSLVAVPTVPLYVLFYLHSSYVEKAKYACLAKCGSVLISLSGSIMSLTAVTVDRYFAVLYPLHYTGWMTKPNVIKLIIVIWVYNIIISLMPSMGVNVWRDGIICDFFLVLPKPFTIFTVPIILFACLFVSSFMYIQIFREASRNKKRVEKFSQQEKASRETRAAKVMFLIFFFFFLFWFPFLICSFLKYIPTSRMMIEIIKNFTLTLAMCNSAVNPIIYCWLRRDFRAAFKAIIQGKSELKFPVNA